MHIQSLAFTSFSQGIPFLHMGSEFMRSKLFLRDSYDYGDWFNRVDFSKQDNFYNVGLPPAEKDQENWPLIKKVLAGHQGRDHVNAKQIHFSSEMFKAMLAIRMSSPLFRLTSEQAIIDKVSFLNIDRALGKDKEHQLGLLVMKIDDNIGEPVDENYQSLIVIFNSSNKEQTFDYNFDGNRTLHYQVHPMQLSGTDEVIPIPINM